MNIFEKTVAQIEKRTKAVHVYSAEIIPVTEVGERLKVEKDLADWSYTFYYDDPNETEVKRVEIAKHSLLQTLFAKPGVKAFRVFSKDTEVNAVYNIDFEIQILKIEKEAK